MRRLLFCSYALAAYGACLAALAYLVGFTGNVLVPRSVDVGPAVPWAEAVVVDLLLLALFGLQHSVMARAGFKRWCARALPAVVERSTYLVATCAVLALLFRFWLPVPAPVVWQVEQAMGVKLLWIVFWLGWAVVLVSSYLIDHFELFGLRQAFAGPSTRNDFKTPLLYRHVRHPLYAGFLLGFWSTPVMTTGRLLLATGMSGYILIGIAFEERDLVARFGDRYRRYREQVGMLVPRFGGRANAAAPRASGRASTRR